MNKSLYLAVGALLGAGAGSAATYFFTKRRYEDLAADAIEEYADHCEARIERIKEIYEDKLVGDVDSEEPEPEQATEEEDEDKTIRNNEGVKKYHHYEGSELPEYASKRIFKKTTKEEEMAKKTTNKVHDITEKEFIESDNEKQTIDVLFRMENDAVEEIWGYQTDNQTTVQARFGKGLIDLIGIDGEDMLDWFEPDEDVTARYFHNDEMNTDFEIVLHCDHDTYYGIEQS